MSEAPALTAETQSSRFDRIYRAYSGELTAYARRLTSNPTEAEDWVAEAFMRTIAATRRGRGPTENVRAYLYAALRSVRAEQARSTVVLLHRDDLGTDHPELVESDRAAQVVDTAVASCAFKRLPARWQEVLTLTAVEDADLADAADRLGISKGAAAVLAFRAREGLRTAYLEEWVTTPQRDECREPRARLARFVRDQLKAAEAAKVRTHLSDCDECVEALAGLRVEADQLRAVPIWLLLPAAAKPLAGAAGAALCWETIRAFIVRLGQQLRDRSSQALTVAAVAVAATLVAVAAMHPWSPSVEAGTAAGSPGSRTQGPPVANGTGPHAQEQTLRDHPDTTNPDTGSDDSPAAAGPGDAAPPASGSASTASNTGVAAPSRVSGQAPSAGPTQSPPLLGALLAATSWRPPQSPPVQSLPAQSLRAPSAETHAGPVLAQRPPRAVGRDGAGPAAQPGR